MLEVVFQLPAPLTESEPSREFIQVIEGEIRDSESNVIIGRISASLVQVGRVADAGEDLFDVMDGQSSEMAEYHAAFFKPQRLGLQRKHSTTVRLISLRWICS